MHFNIFDMEKHLDETFLVWKDMDVNELTKIKNITIKHLINKYIRNTFQLFHH
jgi:hypothetical protein